MVASVSRTRRRTASFAAIDDARVLVQLASPKGARTNLGTAAAARHDRRLTPAERRAVDAVVTAVSLLRARARLAGIDDAGTAVTLVLRDDEATTGGPWATSGRISAGRTNALRDYRSDANAAVLLPVDVALHELTHVVQFAHVPKGVTPHGGLLEGIADAVAILATGDDTLGEGYFGTDAAGRRTGSVREHDPSTGSGTPLAPVDVRYEDAVRDKDDVHAAGGVVVAAIRSIRARIGRDAAERLLWLVIRDDDAWRTGGSWKDFALALRRAAGSDQAARDAVEAALETTGLLAALA